MQAKAWQKKQAKAAGGGALSSPLKMPSAPPKAPPAKSSPGPARPIAATAVDGLGRVELKPPSDMSKMEAAAWKRKQKKQAKAGDGGGPASPPKPKSAPALPNPPSATGGTTMEPPPGMSKMQAMAWKKKQAKDAAAVVAGGDSSCGSSGGGNAKDSGADKLAQNHMAMRIQSRQRGRQSRRQVKERREQEHAATRIQAMQRGRRRRREIVMRQQDASTHQIQASQRAKYFGDASDETQDAKEQAQAASRIQARHRGRADRQTVRRITTERNRAAARIQARHRGRVTRRRSQMVTPPASAAGFAGSSTAGPQPPPGMSKMQAKAWQKKQDQAGKDTVKYASGGSLGAPPAMLAAVPTRTTSVKKGQQQQQSNEGLHLSPAQNLEATAQLGSPSPLRTGGALQSSIKGEATISSPLRRGQPVDGLSAVTGGLTTPTPGAVKARTVGERLALLSAGSQNKSAATETSPGSRSPTGVAGTLASAIGLTAAEELRQAGDNVSKAVTAGSSKPIEHPTYYLAANTRDTPHVPFTLESTQKTRTPIHAATGEMAAGKSAWASPSKRAQSIGMAQSSLSERYASFWSEARMRHEARKNPHIDHDATVQKLDSSAQADTALRLSLYSMTNNEPSGASTGLTHSLQSSRIHKVRHAPVPSRRKSSAMGEDEDSPRRTSETPDFRIQTAPDKTAQAPSTGPSYIVGNLVRKTLFELYGQLAFIVRAQVRAQAYVDAAAEPHDSPEARRHLLVATLHGVAPTDKTNGYVLVEPCLNWTASLHFSAAQLTLR